MKNYLLIISLMAIIMLSGCDWQKNIKYPETRKVDTVDVYVGKEVPDPYRWLEDDNSEETAEWVKAENEVTHKYQLFWFPGT
jgi:prolyl oligopeptidase